MADLLAESDGLVFIEDGMFRLIDAAAPEYSGSSPQSAPPGELVSMSEELGLATFISGFEANEPYVRLEYWSARPHEPEGAWEGTFNGRLRVPGGRLALASGVSMVASQHELPLPPGSYHLGVWCQGRAAVLAGARAAIMRGTVQRGVERWLARLWPDTAPATGTTGSGATSSAR